MIKFKDILCGLVIAILLAFAVPTISVMFEQATTNDTLESGMSDDQWKFLQDYAKLIEYAKMQGYKLTAGELYRTMYQQRYNVMHGLSWTYNSKHLQRKAGDLNLFVNGKYSTKCSDYEVLGDFWESLDKRNKWGGHWHSTKDCPHFERR